MDGRSHIVALAFTAIALPVAAAPAAAKPGTFAGTVGVKVPKGAQADLRAINRKDGTIAASKTIGPSGRFSLSLPPGTYLMVGTVITPKGKVIQKRIGVSLRSGQRRKGAKLTAKKRKRKPKAHAAFIQEKGQITPGRVAFEIPDVVGKTGDADFDAFSPGINDIMLVDLMNQTEECNPAFLEVDRRDELIKLLEFEASPYVDPATRAVRNFIIGEVETRSTITAAPGGARMTMQLFDKSTGKALGEKHEAMIPADDVWPPIEQLAREMAGDICKVSDVYEVTLHIDGEGRFATHTATGKMDSTLRARMEQPGRKVWRATAPLQWDAVDFITKSSCPYIDYVVPVITWSVTILDDGDGQLQVMWTRDGNDGTSASVDCPPDGPGSDDPPPIPGQVGTSLLGIAPEGFSVPYAGGEQALTGGFQDGGDGWFNTGKITVKRSGVGVANG